MKETTERQFPGKTTIADACEGELGGDEQRLPASPDPSGIRLGGSKPCLKAKYRKGPGSKCCFCGQDVKGDMEKHLRANHKILVSSLQNSKKAGYEFGHHLGGWRICR